MEANPTCKEHGRMLEMYCEQCKSLMCVKCLPAHAKKSCKYPIFLPAHAENELLPLYKKRVEIFEENAKATDEAVKELFASSSFMRKELVKLRAKLEGMMRVIDQKIELFEADEEDVVMKKESVRRSVVVQYEEFKEAIKSENLSYIIKMLDKPCNPDISEEEEELSEALKKAAGRIVTMVELDRFYKLISDFSEKYYFLIEDGHFEKQSRYIYGACSPQKDSTVLCRYNIQRKKLECVTDIPQCLSIIQVSGRIFASGGSPPTSATKEYVPRISALIPKAPMKHSKCYHTVQIIDNNSFAAIGGSDSSFLSCCEEYSIVDDEWKELPPLNTPRRFTATVFLYSKLLYAIGGENSNSGIEVLNYSEKKMWTAINIMATEIAFDYSPKALIISESEILILSGGNSNITGLWDLKTNIIKNYPGSKLSDYYSLNQIYVKNRKGYILGHNGHMHIFDLDTRKFTELKYSSILS